MFQKDYKYEIVELLLKKKIHLREIARKLGTNQTTISRKVNHLVDSNVLDFELIGKNKIYFLKNSLEAMQLAYMTENYKFLKIINDKPLLRRIFEKIIENKKIKLAILFGSYAKDEETKRSDIDLYLETENQEIKKETESLNTNLNIKIGKYNKNSLLIKEIEKSHIIIKGVEIYYERNKFFKENL